MNVTILNRPITLASPCDNRTEVVSTEAYSREAEPEMTRHPVKVHPEFGEAIIEVDTPESTTIIPAGFTEPCDELESVR
jgi:hypothetical protein